MLPSGNFNFHLKSKRTVRVTMDYWERKKRLPRGSVVGIAKRRGVSDSYVSLVLRTGQGTPQIKRDLARAMGVPVKLAFPPAASAATPGVALTTNAAESGEAQGETQDAAA